jgi:hypothetical protein
VWKFTSIFYFNVAIQIFDHFLIPYLFGISLLQEVLERMVDPYVLLGMMALLPLLEAVNTLIEFAQRRDIFICDFVAALSRCHSQLFTYYINQDTRWRRDDFHSFNQLIEVGCQFESTRGALVLCVWRHPGCSYS